MRLRPFFLAALLIALGGVAALTLSRLRADRTAPSATTTAAFIPRPKNLEHLSDDSWTTLSWALGRLTHDASSAHDPACVPSYVEPLLGSSCLGARLFPDARKVCGIERKWGAARALVQLQENEPGRVVIVEIPERLDCVDLANVPTNPDGECVLENARAQLKRTGTGGTLLQLTTFDGARACADRLRREAIAREMGSPAPSASTAPTASSSPSAPVSPKNLARLSEDSQGAWLWALSQLTPEALASPEVVRAPHPSCVAKLVESFPSATPCRGAGVFPSPPKVCAIERAWGRARVFVQQQTGAPGRVALVELPETLSCADLSGSSSDEHGECNIQNAVVQIQAIETTGTRLQLTSFDGIYACNARQHTVPTHELRSGAAPSHQ